jgi:hypothetical protein
MEVKKILWADTPQSHLGVFRLIDEDGFIVAEAVHGGLETVQVLRHSYEMRQALAEIAEADSLGEAWTKARLMLAKMK